MVGSIADVKDETAFDGDDAWAWYGGVATDIFGIKVAGGYGDEEFGGLEKTYYNAGLGYGIGLVNLSINYGQILMQLGLGQATGR